MSRMLVVSWKKLLKWWMGLEYLCGVIVVIMEQEVVMRFEMGVGEDRLRDGVDMVE